MPIVGLIQRGKHDYTVGGLHVDFLFFAQSIQTGI